MTAATPKNRRLNRQKLLSYGFAEREGLYHFAVSLADGQMHLAVTVSPDGEVTTKVTDGMSGEEYVLHRVPGAAGAFVGGVRAEYEAVLADIADSCFDPDVFRSGDAKQIIDYAWREYGDELEFLWQKFPDNAVLRRKDTKKWYAALLTVQKSKLGLDSAGMIEILDLRMQPEEKERIIDNRSFFPGYHMNKKHWYTVLLDGSVPIEELCRRIDESYVLAVK